ncbi:MAG: hypothetical protein ACRYFS_03405 [Janthinobacterium lividum]
MAIVKTAISIDENIFQQAEEVASFLKVSRSRAFAMAMEEFAKRQKGEQITRQINESYTDEAADEDRKIVHQMRSAERPHAEMEW